LTDRGGFHGGAREISASGTKDLPMKMEFITGYTIIEAESLQEAKRIARENPDIASVCVYEIMRGKWRVRLERNDRDREVCVRAAQGLEVGC